LGYYTVTNSKNEGKQGKLSVKIPVIDLFAGPGGLGEGFSAFESASGDQPFRVALSIEKDPYAHQTLRLRSFFRQFPKGKAPALYYDVLRQTFPLDELPARLKANSPELFAKWEAAEREAFHVELGSSEEARAAVSKRINEAITNKKEPWVLIGGPPCQAYSVVGRARNKGNLDYRIEDDHRSSLYRQYLRIIADHWPTVFVMENVKGLLSATVNEKRVFDAIISDLQDPQTAFGREGESRRSERYRIVPVVAKSESLLRQLPNPRDFVVESEKYGVPQVRHRVILVGIRQDIDSDLPALTPTPGPSVNQVISDLPRLRSGLSRKRVRGEFVKVTDGPEEWIKTLENQSVNNETEGVRRWLKSLGDDFKVFNEILEVVYGLKVPTDDRGSERQMRHHSIRFESPSGVV
jgi:DNA (cytosine-5)-methyltransferase 1